MSEFLSTATRPISDEARTAIGDSIALLLLNQGDRQPVQEIIGGLERPHLPQILAQGGGIFRRPVPEGVTADPIAYRAALLTVVATARAVVYQIGVDSLEPNARWSKQRVAGDSEVEIASSFAARYKACF